MPKNKIKMAKKTIRKPKRILVVDDDSFWREYVAKLLRELGYEVLEAWDGLEALAYIKKKRPDVLVTDYEMPHMDGNKPVNELGKRRYKFPIIVNSGYSNLNEQNFNYKRNIYFLNF